MRLGLRLQIVMVLGTLLVLANVALFVAVASIAQASMASVRETSARALGRAIAGHVIAAGETRGPHEIASLLEAQVGEGGARAIAVYGPGGALEAEAGDPDALRHLPASLAAGAEDVVLAQTSEGAALLILVPAGGASGRSVATLLPVDPGAAGSRPLVRLVALYTGIVGLALLVFVYIAMTRLVVRPVAALSSAARRVSEGARRLDAPRAGASELLDLGASLSVMTEKLRADEAALVQRLDELERAKAELERAQERLVRSERLASVGRLAAGVAHEIGNPIAAILGFLDLLSAGGTSEAEQKDFLQRMKKETERIHRVLRDLLDFARPASMGGREAPPDPGSVADAARDALALVRPQKAFRDLTVRDEIAPGLPLVTLSTSQIVQVLLNLLLNAADAVDPARGTIALRAMPGVAGAVRIEVEDDGPGVSEDIAERLFEPFATTKEVGKGTGLGLAVCRGLVEAAGGSVTLESGDLGGALFCIELPAASDRHAEPG